MIHLCFLLVAIAWAIVALACFRPVDARLVLALFWGWIAVAFVSLYTLRWIAGRIAALAFLLALSVSPAEAQERDRIFDAGQIAFAVGQSLDTATTLSALQRGGRETNPLLAPFASQPASLIAVKAASTVGTLYLLRKLHGYSPRTARIVTWSLAGTLTAVAVRNARVSR